MDSRSDGDVVGDLEFVEEFPGIACTVDSIVNTFLGIEISDEGGLTKGHTEGVAFEEGVVPLKSDIPGLASGALDSSNIAVINIRQSPASVDLGNPPIINKRPPGAQAEAIGVA